MENNILDENLATNKKKRIITLERNEKEVKRKLLIPRVALFIWAFFYIVGGGYIGISAGLIFLLCGILLNRYSLITTVVAVIVATGLFIYAGIEFNLELSTILPVLIYLILWVGVLNAYRLEKIKAELVKLSLG